MYLDLHTQTNCFFLKLHLYERSFGEKDKTDSSFHEQSGLTITLQTCPTGDQQAQELENTDTAYPTNFSVSVSMLYFYLLKSETSQHSKPSKTALVGYSSVTSLTHA